MDMTFERDNGVLTASLVGRLDGAVAQGAHTELLHMVEETNRGLILDLRDVAFISSAGLRIILLVAKEFEKQNGKLVLCEPFGGPPRSVRHQWLRQGHRHCRQPGRGDGDGVRR